MSDGPFLLIHPVYPIDSKTSIHNLLHNLNICWVICCLSAYLGHFDFFSWEWSIYLLCRYQQPSIHGGGHSSLRRMLCNTCDKFMKVLNNPRKLMLEQRCSPRIEHLSHMSDAGDWIPGDRRKGERVRREFVMFLEGERMLSLENEGSMYNGTEVGRGFWMR